MNCVETLKSHQQLSFTPRAPRKEEEALSSEAVSQQRAQQREDAQDLAHVLENKSEKF